MKRLITSPYLLKMKWLIDERYSADLLNLKLAQRQLPINRRAL